VKSGGIDLSSRDGALASGAFVAGDVAGSRMLKMVRAGKMPPTGKLSADDIATLENWIRSGAPWVGAPLAVSKQPLWSLKPVKAIAPPHSPFDSLSKNPIDRFIFAKLQSKGLKPSPPADRRELLRRVTIDLTGLPPTPAEIDAFLADRRPDAYERVVDRLLASSAYGERWARHWLDVVRYGESNGYEQNHLRANAWPYRDYVIRAFNTDTPYDQFIKEQLAGDVLSTTDPSIGAATGFLVAGIHDTVGIQTEEGTRQQRANDLDDIVSTTAASFLGLTVGCARCHDHKFDPIPQRDYYRLTACFAGVHHGERSLATPAQRAERDKQVAALTQKLQAVQNQINDLDSQARQIVLRRDGLPPETRPAVNARRNEDDFPATDARFLRFTVLKTNDGAEPCLDELQVFGDDPGRDVATAANGAKPSASSLLPGYVMHTIEHINDGILGNDHSWISNTPGTGWAQVEFPAVIRVRRVVWSRDGGAIPRFDDRLPVAYRIEVSLDGKQWQTVSTEAGRTGSNNYIHPETLLATMTPDQRNQRNALAAEQSRLERDMAKAQAAAMTYAGEFTDPETIYLLRIGDPMQRIEPEPPGALSCVKTVNADLTLDSSAKEPARRLALANWIADPQNPLTARVMVNRIWQHHFGRGIVSTPSDFGHNGEKPTHPELLDWLADDFVRGGWHIKRLQRLIVTSYAYRQSTAANPAGIARDAGDQYLWRMPLQRMEAEAVRDAILQTSGKLDRTMGGPGFQLFSYRVVNVAIYGPRESFDSETFRRSVYQQAARSIHYDLLSTFDCPESSQRAPRRDSTTTALQALSLLNAPFITQQAGFFAGRVRATAGADPGRQVAAAFRLALGRAPRDAEKKPCAALIASDGLPALCRVLLNCNEFLYY
jgi:hypothetical protein